jgi:glucose/arabinose dehydrogenase
MFLFHFRVGTTPLRRACVIEPFEPRQLLTTLPSGFHETVVAAGLTSPTAIDVAPDGRVFLTDQSGHVRIIAKDTLVATPFADLSAQVDGSNERGMMGLALDPDFGNNPYVYVFYTANTPISHNRISRLTVDPNNPNQLLPGSEVALMDLPDLTAGGIWHVGGAMQFGIDGKLYVCVGDQMEKDKAQDPNSTLGKVLRINADGSIPSDNPFYDTRSGDNRAIWAAGLRNPFTAAIQPGTGRFFINDVGAQAYEEINEGKPGANFGWSTTEGPFNQSTYPNFAQPFYAYSHNGGQAAITAGTFYNPPAGGTFGSKYVGKYFFADLMDSKLRTIDPSSKVVSEFASNLANPVGMDTAYDGAIYVLSRGAGPAGATGEGLGRVLKIQADLPLFGAPIGYPTGVDSHGVTNADFNGDKILDLAVVSAGTNQASVLFGNGDGTFKPAVHYNVGVEPKAIMAADLNGDGKIDLATCSQRDSMVSVLINDTTGAFEPAVHYAGPTTSHELSLADLDGDKDVDIAVVGARQTLVRVLFNNGQGVFGGAADYAVGSAPHSVIAKDLNNDGKIDLAVADLNSSNLAVLINKGGGQFNAAKYYATGTSPHSVRAADFNGDGKADLVAAAQGSNAVSVLINNGDGTFKTRVNYTVGKTPKGIAIGDVNGDGKLDIVNSNTSSNYPDGTDPAGMTVSVLLGKGNGTFNAALTFPAGNTPFAVSLGDFDRDGDLDLATANWHGNDVTVLKNNTKENGGASTPVGGSGTISGYCFNDSNADGVYNTGDSKTGGKTVFLDSNNNGKLDSGERSMVSDSGGTFSFGNLGAGTYHVRRVFPSGYTYSTALIDVDLASGQTMSGLTIGSKPGSSLPPPPPTGGSTGTISGYCFNDSNANGVLNTGEAKTSGKTVFLDTNNNGKLDTGEKSMVTDSSGAFKFTSLVAGTYHVRRVFPSGYTYSTALANIALADGQAVSSVAIGSKAG